MLKVSRHSDIDLMRRCIALARSSLAAGEYPFAAVIACNGVFVCESINRARQDQDVNRHAEVVAISLAQQIRGINLADCTLYSTVEPCAQCSYAVREAQIGRVIYGLKSPLMGGHSRWDILSDAKLSTVLPEVFLPAPEVVSGFLHEEVEALFREWSPLIWSIIKARGVFVSDTEERVQLPHRRGFVATLFRRFRMYIIDRIRQRRGAPASTSHQPAAAIDLDTHQQ